MHEMVLRAQDNHKVAIVGVGGAGCRFVSAYAGRVGMDTIAINTDKDSLRSAKADQKIYICKGVLHGEGTSGDAGLGKTCAEIHIDEIRHALAGYDRVFVVAGLGGGTGTGAAPVVIEAAQSQNILTFAIAIMPFSFEGRRMEVAKEGYGRIRAVCPCTSEVRNDAILHKLSDRTMDDAYDAVNTAIMAHIEACLLEYSLKDDFADTEEKDDGFDDFVRTSPIFAFTSA